MASPGSHNIHRMLPEARLLTKAVSHGYDLLIIVAEPKVF